MSSSSKIFIVNRLIEYAEYAHSGSPLVPEDAAVRDAMCNALGVSPTGASALKRASESLAPVDEVAALNGLLDFYKDKRYDRDPSVRSKAQIETTNLKAMLDDLTPDDGLETGWGDF